MRNFAKEGVPISPRLDQEYLMKSSPCGYEFFFTARKFYKAIPLGRGIEDASRSWT